MTEFERSIIAERSAAGVAVARAKGVRMGPVLDDGQAAKLAHLWPTGDYSKTELAKLHNVSVSTVKRTLRRLGLDSINEKHANGMLVKEGSTWAQ